MKLTGWAWDHARAVADAVQGVFAAGQKSNGIFWLSAGTSIPLIKC